MFAVVAGCSGEPAPAAAGVPATAPQAGATTAQAMSPAPGGSSCATSPSPSVADLMGRYVVRSADRYRGGLTTDEQARDRVGSEVVVTEATFRLGGQEVPSPRYELACHDVALSEGELPTHKQRLLGTFHRLGGDRSVVWELQVIDPADDEREAGFEVLSGNGSPELWYLYDGWRFVLQPAGGSADPGEG